MTVAKKTQLTKIMPSLYSGCINTENQKAQGTATAQEFNNLILSMQKSTATGILDAINMDAVKCSYEQCLHAMQVWFQQLCDSQPGKFKKDGIGSKKGNGSEFSMGNVKFKDTCYH